MTRDEMDQDARVLLDAHNENERRIVCLSDRLRRAWETLSRVLESPEARRVISISARWGPRDTPPTLSPIG